MFSRDSKAQGTIEYLVIIAVVVVISLIVVGLFVTIFDSPSQQITDSSSQAGAVATGGISIVESVIDPEGDSLIKLSNNSSDAITLTKINIGGVDNNFSEQLVGLDSKVFSLSSLNSSCPCVSGKKSVKCEVKIIYTTASGTTQTEYRTINAQCVSDSTSADDDRVVNVIDSVAPVVLLNSPVSAVSSRLVDFNFSVADSSAIDSCTLFVGDDSNVYDGIVSGVNVVRYSFSADEYFDWNVICIDNFSNIGYSESRSLDVDSNVYQITTCIELSEIGLTGNYELMNDINCYYDTQNASGALYNLGLGFDPIGSNSLKFSGKLNGNNHIIQNLRINRTTDYSGLFAYLSGGTILNLKLENGYVKGRDKVGSIAGQADNAILTNCSNSGTVLATRWVAGGIVGFLYLGQITDCNNSGNITNSGSDGGAGGITGGQDTSRVINCINTGNISTVNGAGGITGGNNDSQIINSYNTGNVTASSANAGGIAGTSMRIMTSAEIINSYNTGTVNATEIYAGGIVGQGQNNSIIKNSFNVGEIIGGSDLGAIAGACINGCSTTNTWWFNTLSNCCGTGTCNTCTKANGANDFFSPTQNVYDTTSPVWDLNWNWTGLSYPILN